MPEEARQEAVERAEPGERIIHPAPGRPAIRARRRERLHRSVTQPAIPAAVFH
jgi:hypothetical protein